MRHPEPAVDALWQLGLDATTPLICSAGRTGFYIDAIGNYWKCGAVASKFPPLGNILRDGELRFAPTAVCDRFPTEQANPGAEIQCWCVENKVLDVTRAGPADLASFYDRAFFHIDVSRLCNYSCHYCTVPKEIFEARSLAKKRDHLSAWARKPYMDRADLALIGREIFAKCDNVQLRIAGMMEPLMNPDILALFEVCRDNIDRLAEIRLMSNLGVERTFETLLEMGFGAKLHTVVSMHVVDDNFDPFRVVRQIKRAQDAGTVIGSHIVPSPVVREVMLDYLDFFSLHGVRVRPVPYIVDDPSGTPLEKGTQRTGHVPRHYPALKAFLGGGLEGRFPGKSYAAYLEQLRSLNADTYEVLRAFQAEGETDGESGRRRIFMLRSEAAAPVTTAPAVARPLAPPRSPVTVAVARLAELRLEAMNAASGGDFELAAALLEVARRTSPEDPQVLCDLASLALAEGRWQPAVDFAQQALRRAPRHVASRFALGVALARSGEVGQAIEALSGVCDGEAAAALRAEIGEAADEVATLIERLKAMPAAAA